MKKTIAAALFTVTLFATGCSGANQNRIGNVSDSLFTTDYVYDNAYDDNDVYDDYVYDTTGNSIAYGNTTSADIFGTYEDYSKYGTSENINQNGRVNLNPDTLGNNFYQTYRYNDTLGKYESTPYVDRDYNNYTITDYTDYNRNLTNTIGNATTGLENGIINQYDRTALDTTTNTSILDTDTRRGMNNTKNMTRRTVNNSTTNSLNNTAVNTQDSINNFTENTNNALNNTTLNAQNALNNAAVNTESALNRAFEKTGNTINNTVDNTRNAIDNMTNNMQTTTTVTNTEITTR